MGSLVLALLMMSVLVAAQDDLGPGFDDVNGESRAELTTGSSFISTIFAKAGSKSAPIEPETSLQPTPTSTRTFTTPSTTTFITTSTKNSAKKVGKRTGNATATTNEPLITSTNERGRTIANWTDEAGPDDNQTLAILSNVSNNDSNNETLTTTTATTSELINTTTNDTTLDLNDLSKENVGDGVNRESREKDLLSNSSESANSTESEESDLLELSELASFGDDMSNLTKTNLEQNELVLNLGVNKSSAITSTEVSLSDAPIVVADRERNQETSIDGLSLQVQIYILAGAFGTLIFLTILFLVTLFLRVESIRNELRRTATQSRYQVEPAQHTVLSQPRSYDNGGFGGGVEMQERPVDADSELRRMGYNVYNGRGNRDDTVDSGRKRPMSAAMRYDESVMNVADRRSAPGGRVRTLDPQRY